LLAVAAGDGVSAEGRLEGDLAALISSMRADYLHMMQRMSSRQYRETVRGMI
jgi:hypothetical protein